MQVLCARETINILFEMVKLKMLSLFNVIDIIIVAISSGVTGFLLTGIVDGLRTK